MMYQRNRMKVQSMKKRELAVFIASTLFNKPVPETNWKVNELMKRKKDVLIDLFWMAARVGRVK